VRNPSKIPGFVVFDWRAVQAIKIACGWTYYDRRSSYSTCFRNPHNHVPGPAVKNQLRLYFAIPHVVDYSDLLAGIARLLW